MGQQISDFATLNIEEHPSNIVHVHLFDICDDILAEIFQFLPSSDIAINLWYVSKIFRNVIKTKPRVWRGCIDLTKGDIPFGTNLCHIEWSSNIQVLCTGFQLVYLNPNVPLPLKTFKMGKNIRLALPLRTGCFPFVSAESFLESSLIPMYQTMPNNTWQSSNSRDNALITFSKNPYRLGHQRYINAWFVSCLRSKKIMTVWQNELRSYITFKQFRKLIQRVFATCRCTKYCNCGFVVYQKQLWHPPPMVQPQKEYRIRLT